jgi:hypothetical protein
MEENMREVYTADKMYKVEMMQQMLTENKIECYLLNQKGSGLLLGEIRLFVDEKDEKRALELISKHDM